MPLPPTPVHEVPLPPEQPPPPLPATLYHVYAQLELHAIYAVMSCYCSILL